MRTIKRAAEIDRLFTEGRRVSHPALLVLVLPTQGRDGSTGRLLFVAGKRLGSAVLRNRCKRVLRAAARRAGGPWPGWDMALVARERTATSPHEIIDESLAAALRTIGDAPCRG